ncbi:MAG: hypothetical protein B7Y36_18030 [Novosphingobium sp. 28-62-57]|uniref:hypothetical protein n=1 Tax=unclassified Novosphingobium TaxID=2644732 RepID=UPI000BC9ED8C|nr:MULTISPECIES: hypothetical protein [unclassified Novosphingobium]OYW48362.1 MAG: hypothetical protein B7Z34_14195 [Novosphingobium sp. 12-62-10]OYZ08091.1 MAG: hypothetical protein B7Y36_18030 [Novosphingobium sp. 28-62-57]OZA35969.1 MAG: hypothetical protein B7X92_08235 [Novosphingobium sp. 17-62-9]HQS68794.1 hypothetical protein [Novosphingobium sp.]
MNANRLSLLALMAAIAIAPVSASAADRDRAPRTKLERCGEQTCLRVTGHRADSAASVLIAQHEVAVTGGKSWRVSLPLQTVRAWSAPAARTIAVEVAGNDRRQMEAELPIGVFGNSAKLAFLSVSAL